MTRREHVLNKLQSLSNDEISEAIKQLTHHVKARLRFRSLKDRTKTGAHGEKNLGMHAIDYYVGECITRLYSPGGWDWKFEKFTLADQLMRIANKLLSDKVQEYIRKKSEMPIFDDRDAGDIYDLDRIASENFENEVEVFSKLVKLAHEQSKGDDNLEYFTIRYFEKASFETISNEMNISIEQVYVLRKKLVRRLTNLKKELTA